VIAPAERRSIDDLAPGTTFRTAFRFDADDMAAFAALSGDRNPLHTDPVFARSRGFAGRVVYGAMILARLSEAIGMHLPGRDAIWTGLAADFRKPLYVDEEATLTVEVTDRLPATGTVELAFVVDAGGRTVAKGTVATIVRGDG
jgi:acyl dehydratase